MHTQKTKTQANKLFTHDIHSMQKSFEDERWWKNCWHQIGKDFPAHNLKKNTRKKEIEKKDLMMGKNNKIMR